MEAFSNTEPRLLAELAVKAIYMLRDEYPPEVVDGTLVEPVFHWLPEDEEQAASQLAEELLRGSSDTSLVRWYGVPDGWRGVGGGFGLTPEEAAIAAREKAALAKCRAAAQDKADAAKGWPALKGTGKQVAWAKKLRAKHYYDSKAKLETTAAYWITKYGAKK